MARGDLSDAIAGGSALKARRSPGVDKVAAQSEQSDWLPMMGALVRTYQSFHRVAELDIRRRKLTGPQFDIITMLGTTNGLTCKELGLRTLITKGTMTGVLNRLEAKGLLVRDMSSLDRRSYIVRLTCEGRACLDTVFPAHMAYLGGRFGKLPPEECQRLKEQLEQLQMAFETPVC